MLDCLSYTHLVSPVTSMYKRLSKIFTTTDYAITVPFDIKSLPCFSLLKAKTLRQTKARWCWFDKANKDDKDAGTRLGTLRLLPYEIRQQIFQIVLEDYFDAVEEQLEQKLSIFNEDKYECVGRLDTSMLKIEYEGLHCCCKRDKAPSVFDLRSYFSIWPAIERQPMSLRLASPSIQREFDSIFLARSTFEFTCPLTLHRFLDQLSPSQQRQLKRLSLSMFEYWVCRSDSMPRRRRRDQWIAACQRLPPGLKSVEMQPPLKLSDIPVFWTNRSTAFYSGQAGLVNRLAMELLEVPCRKISRASPRAVIFWKRDRFLGTEDYAVLDAGLAELEPWSEEWYTYMDGRDEESEV